MKKKVLKPIEPKDSWSYELTRELARVFKQGIYDDLLELSKKPLGNANESRLYEAIRSGKIRYLNGKFSGEFTAATSKELREMGGVFDARSRVWKLPLSGTTPEVQAAVGAAARSVGVLESVMNSVLDYTSDKVKILTGALDLKPIVDKTTGKIDAAFKKTVLKEMSVQPKLTGADAIRFDERYVKSVTRPIVKVLGQQARTNIDNSTNKFAEEEIMNLRQEISEWVSSGKSRKGLQDLIEARLRVGKDRAKFIARQETALYTSDFKEAQYQSASIEKYEWSAVMDNRTRHRHAELDGKIFKWSDPPVVDLKTQERANPGVSFRCRCQSKPIVEFD